MNKINGLSIQRSINNKIIKNRGKIERTVLSRVRRALRGSPEIAALPKMMPETRAAEKAQEIIDSIINEVRVRTIVKNNGIDIVIYYEDKLPELLLELPDSTGDLLVNLNEASGGTRILRGIRVENGRVVAAGSSFSLPSEIRAGFVNRTINNLNVDDVIREIVY